ncbi:hypothetical protein HanRHA438_Chr16g0768711 [Helianthus annuus]|nr:hypothetical protein HanRHA438_Chr16g0768711 [Helianthus annuus]
MTAYCQALKVIYDQLTNVGSPITEEQLVLQLLMGLNDQYESTTTIIQQTSPLPDFYETRSRLCMAESRKQNQARQAAQAAGTALIATTDNRTAQQTDQQTSRSDSRYDTRTDQHRDQSSRGRGRGRNRGRGRGGSSGRGRGNTSASGNSAPGTYPPGFSPWPFNYNNWASPSPTYSPIPWAQWNMIPPCPYPTVQQRPSTSGPGILGPRPAQSYVASYANYAPTDIDQAIYTMDTGPQDPESYPTMQ